MMLTNNLNLITWNVNKYFLQKQEEWNCYAYLDSSFFYKSLVLYILKSVVCLSE